MSRHLIESRSQTFDGVVESALDFASDHHAHNHVQIGMQDQTHTCIVVRDLMQLYPKCEIDGQAVLAVAGDFDVSVFGAFGYAQFQSETFNLERACIFRGAPLFDLVLEGSVSMSKRLMKGYMDAAGLNICCCFDSYFSSPIAIELRNNLNYRPQRYIKKYNMVPLRLS